jgi:hypothetical protein
MFVKSFGPRPEFTSPYTIAHSKMRRPGIETRNSIVTEAGYVAKIPVNRPQTNCATELIDLIMDCPPRVGAL